MQRFHGIRHIGLMRQIPEGSTYLSFYDFMSSMDLSSASHDSMPTLRQNNATTGFQNIGSEVHPICMVQVLDKE
jgi:hypothetical protein